MPMHVPALSHDELVEMILDVTSRTERRRFPRRSLTGSVRIRAAEGTWITQSVDVSAGGILLQLSSDPMPPLSGKLEISFPLPGAARDVTIEARPVRLMAPRRGSDGAGFMAAVFVHRDLKLRGDLERALGPRRWAGAAEPLRAVAAS